jgi:HSP20 family protein
MFVSLDELIRGFTSQSQCLKWHGRAAIYSSVHVPKEAHMNALTTRNSGLFDDFFREFAPGFFVRPLHGEGLPSQIKLDVKEADGAFKVEAEIPGVKKEDIQVSIDRDVISLRAEIQQEDKKTENGKFVHSERYYGAVSRTFQLPAEVDESRAKARYENGVLTLTLPRKEGARSRRISIE